MSTGRRQYFWRSLSAAPREKEMANNSGSPGVTATTRIVVLVQTRNERRNAVTSLSSCLLMMCQ